MFNNELYCPPELLSLIQDAGLSISSAVRAEQDSLIWCAHVQGQFSVASAYDSIRRKGSIKPWASPLWSNPFHPTIQANCCKLWHDTAVTDNKIRSLGIYLASQCPICKSEEEYLYHILWTYIFASDIWSWVCRKFLNTSPLILLSVASISYHIEVHLSNIFGGQ